MRKTFTFQASYPLRTTKTLIQGLLGCHKSRHFENREALGNETIFNVSCNVVGQVYTLGKRDVKKHFLQNFWISNENIFNFKIVNWFLSINGIRRKTINEKRKLIEKEILLWQVWSTHNYWLINSSFEWSLCLYVAHS